jgi:hypothetical protein
MTPLCMSQRSHWLRCACHSGVNDSAEIFSKFESLHSGVIDSAVTKIGDYKVDFLASTNPYWKRLSPVSQGPRGSCLMKKTRGRKSRVRVPLKRRSMDYCINFSDPADFATNRSPIWVTESSFKDLDLAKKIRIQLDRDPDPQHGFEPFLHIFMQHTSIWIEVCFVPCLSPFELVLAKLTLQYIPRNADGPWKVRTIYMRPFATKMRRRTLADGRLAIRTWKS